MKNELKISCIMSKDTLPVTGGEQAYVHPLRQCPNLFLS